MIGAQKRGRVFLSSESHNEKPDIEPIRPGMDPDRTNAGEESTGLAPPASDLQSHGMIGRSFAHYQILKELGHGGQGYVFLAEDKNLHRQVAVKILHNLQALNPKTRMRFAREAEAASKITHPGICAVHEFGEFEGMPYIAMQYVEGTPLSTRISSIQQSGSETTSFIDFETTQGDNRKPTPSKPESKTSASSSTSQSTPNTRDSIAEVVEMIESIARALHAAHEQNLIHRDIKPANIIISKDGTPVILDFGLARDSDSDAATLTQSGDLMGTPVYMSPEQIAGHRIRMDRRTDVYSLGVTLYECLTLHRPFEAATRERLFQAILTKEATDPSKLNRAISTDLRVIIQTAMAKDPDRRYQTAEGLADDLKAVQEYRPIAAKPVSIFGRAARWSKRHPARACLILALVIGLPLITGLLGYIRANQPQLEKQALIERDARVEKHLEKGFYELHHGSSKKAIEAFELALDQDGDSVEASFGYAIALIEQNRPQDAVKELNRIASITPDPTILNPVRMDALYVLGKKSEADALRKVETHLDSTIAWFIAGTRALQRGEQLSELSPKRMKAFEFAQECLIRANQTSPRRRRAFLFQLAHAVGHTGNMKIGRPVSDSIAHLWPNSAMASFWSAFALGQGDRPREKVLYANAISLAPDWAMLRKNYALCLGSLGEI
ncbi:MAG: serine/threonine protein kinase, partial [Planctomycetota bacterium]